MTNEPEPYPLPYDPKWWVIRMWDWTTQYGACYLFYNGTDFRLISYDKAEKYRKKEALAVILALKLARP